MFVAMMFRRKAGAEGQEEDIHSGGKMVWRGLFELVFNTGRRRTRWKR
jgi:hypothetical protein